MQVDRKASKHPGLQFLARNAVHSQWTKYWNTRPFPKSYFGSLWDACSIFCWLHAGTIIGLSACSKRFFGCMALLIREPLSAKISSNCALVKAILSLFTSFFGMQTPSCGNVSILGVQESSRISSIKCWGPSWLTVRQKWWSMEVLKSKRIPYTQG